MGERCGEDGGWCIELNCDATDSPVFSLLLVATLRKSISNNMIKIYVQYNKYIYKEHLWPCVVHTIVEYYLALQRRNTLFI